MSRNEIETTDRLGELLRRGDPAAGIELSARDAREMRHRMLAAAEKTKRRRLPTWAFRPAWAIAATVLVLAVALVFTWRNGDAPPRTPEAPVRIVKTPRQSPPPQGSAPALEPEESREEPTRQTSLEPRLAPAQPPGPSSTEVASHERSRRQVQMEAPGGTRIVWVLDPDLTL